MTTPAAIVLVALAGVGVAVLAGQLFCLRGTTLVGPAYWALATLVAVTAVELFVGLTGSSRINELRYLAATLSFCPLMSQLGAKRPQDKAWHAIVFSLWIVLALPALQHLALARGGEFEVHFAQALMMLALLALTIVNAGPTSMVVPSTLFAYGQLLLLADHLPLVGSLASHSVPSGLLLLVAAALAKLLLLRSRRAGQPLDNLWLDYRDLVGLLWALRVAERFNSTAADQEWPIRLSLHGFTQPDGQPLDDLPADIELVVRRSLANLLRRFVSPDWIAARLGESID